MTDAETSSSNAYRKFLREPLVHFFALGALLFVVNHFVVGEPRTITITRGLKAELARRFQDQNGRKPNTAELAKALREWERDEALYREALLEHLDRDDPGVRTGLIAKMRDRAAFERLKREPTDGELHAWLDSHRSLYETPLRYDFEFIAFPKTEPNAERARDEFEQAIGEGKNPASLGRPVVGGDLTLDDMKGRVEPELIGVIPGLPPGTWQRVETKQTFLLARVKHVGGGLPSFDALKPRLTEDWSFAERHAALEAIVDRVVLRYHFVERP